ncbi:oxygen-independent coproporphyrinogen III oxidase [Arcobacter nitrofigilis DSM 7299]|uniref:Heme chaperone HemW n=1 Tax=Arcobacter nitrofigilis (strain ATCC 33309 / DSM 7299 / CCUG 15893 / LMG 7604 / NCTC 12251 / CI) TaxID=572480 RepID=D5V1F5_ARCNC|nr:radical SAM family heme chaperone HemW [Arcobacter nitrofigilis]ADG93389.1 oxygen-independent coproporphyrinogen III oxidase [Arcobacter nitrofigilis DSM 7299]
MLLYIHIPFCDSKCFYCAFNSYVDRFHLKQTYMKAIEKQLIYDIEHYLKDEKIETVFIGGGTPSCVDFKEYENIFRIISPYLIENCEITSEANPNSATKEWLQGMRDLGVNRISFGVQSFNDKKLKYLNRAHNSNSAISAIQNAKCIGFNSINCDIIYGVQGDNFEKLKYDFNMINDQNIDHISAYSLTLEEGTKFFNKSHVKIDDEELSYKLFDYLKGLGYEQYEISNFSKSKKTQSKHNFGYWEYTNYLGIGTGAVGFVDNFRYYPNKNIEQYIENPISYEKEYMDEVDIKTEKVLLGLRSNVGVNLAIFNENELKKAKILIEEKKLYKVDNKIYNYNFLLADEISLFILD